jgi:uncharacterized repeat protein (TIGR03837 family)
MGMPRWDLFCRVIDNHGDIGVCWRLAADLATRGVAVRLWIDDASALQWMAPHGADGVTVLAWPAANDQIDIDGVPGDVVVEAFGCELPDGFVRRMAAMPRAPVWINLEYLSAEPFVERAHRLPSPQSGGPGAGLRKWFFYPGLSERTGGLIREPDLLQRQQAFNAADWLRTQGVQIRDSEQRVSLFCYEQAALPALLDRLAQQPSLLLAAHGHAAQQVARCLGAGLQRGGLRVHLLPALTQRDYDHLLWACDLNFVRGEDSFVRAQWAGKPFVWQIYPQLDGAHSVKLDAFLARFLNGAEPTLAESVLGLWRSWNAADHELPAIPVGVEWSSRCAAWRAGLLAQDDLTSRLLGFVAESR